MTCHSKRRPRIEVRTTPNGYTLDADGLQNGCFYFSPQELLQGFMSHVGMNITKELDLEKMGAFLDATIRWRDNAENVREIQRLNAQIDALKAKNNGLKRRVADERAKLLKVVKGVRESIESFGPTGRLRRHLSDIISDYNSLHNFKRDAHGIPVLGYWYGDENGQSNEDTGET